MSEKSSWGRNAQWQTIELDPSHRCCLEVLERLEAPMKSARFSCELLKNEGNSTKNERTQRKVLCDNIQNPEALIFHQPPIVRDLYQIDAT